MSEAPASAIVSNGLEGPLISGARIQKRPLTRPELSFSQFGYVSAAIDWQGLYAPFIVELFTVCFFKQNPGACHAPAGRCHHRQAPDASAR